MKEGVRLTMVHGTSESSLFTYIGLRSLQIFLNGILNNPFNNY